MRMEGSLSQWNDERGFGFIAPREGGPELFVHISAFPRDGRRPATGERLWFEVEVDARGRKRAVKLARSGDTLPTVPRRQARSAPRPRRPAAGGRQRHLLRLQRLPRRGRAGPRGVAPAQRTRNAGAGAG